MGFGQPQAVGPTLSVKGKFTTEGTENTEELGEEVWFQQQVDQWLAFFTDLYHDLYLSSTSCSIALSYLST